MRKSGKLKLAKETIARLALQEVAGGTGGVLATGFEISMNDNTYCSDCGTAYSVQVFNTCDSHNPPCVDTQGSK